MKSVSYFLNNQNTDFVATHGYKPKFIETRTNYSHTNIIKNTSQTISGKIKYFCGDDDDDDNNDNNDDDNEEIIIPSDAVCIIDIDEEGDCVRIWPDLMNCKKKQPHNKFDLTSNLMIEHYISRLR